MKRVGFCIGNERQEFLSLVEEPRPGVQVNVWARTPALALVYPDGIWERMAYQLERSGWWWCRSMTRAISGASSGLVEP
jgi:hypothetical protein